MNGNTKALADLLIALGRAGIALAPHPSDPTRLRYRPSQKAQPWLSALRLHREMVLALLVTGDAPVQYGDEDARYSYGERLAVAEDMGLPIHPGSAAWLVATGESVT